MYGDNYTNVRKRMQVGSVSVPLPSIFDNLSRRLQPGYNYVGQTNDRQPLHISAVGRLRDYLPNSWLLSWPGPACAYPPPYTNTGSRLSIAYLETLSWKWTREKKRNHQRRDLLKNRTILHSNHNRLLRVYIWLSKEKFFRDRICVQLTQLAYRIHSVLTVCSHT